MPYIKEKLRPPFDEVIKAIKQKGMEQYVLVAFDVALEDFKGDKGLKVIDGCMNYLFSKLLKYEDNPHVHKEFIKEAIKRVYLSPVRYYNLNRLGGLLHWMIVEFDRRGWGNDDTVPFLKGLQRFYRKTYITYEKKKRKENGDI